jgi:hypothetical protein
MDVWNAFGIKLSDIIEMAILFKNEYHASGNVLYQEPSDKYEGSKEMRNLGSMVTERERQWGKAGIGPILWIFLKTCHNLNRKCKVKLSL